MKPAPVACEPAHVALAINIGATDLAMYQPAGISGHAYETAPEYELRRVLKVEKALADGSHKGRWVVCAEPIPAGKAGRVYVAGVCLANILNADDPSAALCADIMADQAYLDGKIYGRAAAQVLWQAAHNNAAQHLALIRLGRPGMMPGEVHTWYAHARTNAAVTRSGNQTVDGVALVAGNFCLDGNTGGSKGLYRVEAGAWTPIWLAGADTLGYVIMLLEGGTAWGRFVFYVGKDYALWVSSGPYLSA